LPDGPIDVAIHYIDFRQWISLLSEAKAWEHRITIRNLPTASCGPLSFSFYQICHPEIYPLERFSEHSL
jgi:hypothetical protein